MKTGDKVVMVSYGPFPGSLTCNPDDFIVTGPQPEMDKVYVINKVLPAPQTTHLSLVLIGTTVIYKQSGTETGWDSRAFRKLDELKQEARIKQQETA